MKTRTSARVVENRKKVILQAITELHLEGIKILESSDKQLKEIKQKFCDDIKPLVYWKAKLEHDFDSRIRLK